MKETRCNRRRPRVLAAVAVACLACAAMLSAPGWAQKPSAPPVSTTAAADSDTTRVAAPASGAVTDATRDAPRGFFGNLRNSYIGQMYVKGGICMHPLLLCAIVGLVLIIERLWTLWRARINTRSLMIDVLKTLRKEGPRGAMHVCEGQRGPIAAILHSGLMRAHRGPEAVEKAIHTAGSIEMAFLERGLLALATISNVAPLLGFLGTVTGMIKAFAAIAAAEQVSAKIVARGIEEALITTAVGLMIAVPVSAFYSYFVLSIDRFVLEMEEASAELVDELLDEEYRRATGQPAAPVVQP
ncbi:MAG TPA: MotA/TolQ/ExbB proton channel family protein [Candidatus Krumholzibacteria bacterium]|nr:MotA/TolQ/ExbB proton channel family protein [Candidatus Krumholzibacteria bacterium]